MAGFTRYSDYDRFAWVYDRHWGSGESACRRWSA